MVAALAWQAEQDVLCIGCGHPKDETMSPGNEDAYEAEKLVCFACRARGHRAEATTDADDTAGVFYTTRRKEG